MQEEEIMIYNNLDQLKQELAVEGRVMGLDIGTKIIGVALSFDHGYLSFILKLFT